MATNRFFNNTGLAVTDGILAKAIQLNSVTDRTNTAFELIQEEIDSLALDNAQSRLWADSSQGVTIDPVNYPNSYSSRANAEESKGWAQGIGGVSTEADGVTVIPSSAKEHRDSAIVAQTGAEDAQSDAESARDLAQEWSEKATGSPITGYPGSYSSRHHSTEAAESAGEAADSASEASIYETGAEAARDESIVAQSWSNKWAVESEDILINDGVHTPGYSAYHWAQKASAIVGGGVISVAGSDPIYVDNTDVNNPIVSWVGDKSDVGLSNVDNTSDADKPISTSTQTALSSKVDTVTPENPPIAANIIGTELQISWEGTKDDVGLSNVNNTSDSNKPISNATQVALDGKEDHLGTPGTDGYLLSSTTGNVRSWVSPPQSLPPGGAEDAVLAKASGTDYDVVWSTSIGGGGLDWTTAPISTNTVAVAGKGYAVDTSSGTVQLTLPSVPSAGDQVAYKDYANSFDDFNLTVNAGTELIEGDSSTLTVNGRGSGGTLVYIDVTKGWLIVDHTPTDILDTPVFITSEPVTGGWIGGGIKSITGNTVTMRAFSVMDDTLTIAIYKDSTTDIVIGTTADEIYNIFAVKYDSGTYGYEVDTDVNGANLPVTVVAKRWDCFVKTNASGVVVICAMNGDTISYTDRDESAIGSLTTAFSTVDHSSVMPPSRIAEIIYGGREPSTTNAYILTSLDGANNESVPTSIASESTDGPESLNAWGNATGQGSIPLPFSTSRLFVTNVNGAILQVRWLRLKR